MNFDISSIIDYKNLIELTKLYALNIFFAIVIFLAGKWIVNKIVLFFETIMTKTHAIDETLISFLKSIIYYTLLVLVILTAINKLGVNTTSFFAILGAAGLAVGLALKDSLANFAAGVMIIFFRPYKNKDSVIVAGISGVVEEIKIFNTQLKTGDNQTIIIPNSKIINDTIINVMNKPTRRVDLILSIGYDDDLQKAKQILLDIATNDNRVLKNEQISIGVSELAESSVNLFFKSWVKTKDYWDVKNDFLEKVKLEFDKAGITIPFPQQDVHHYDKK